MSGKRKESDRDVHGAPDIVHRDDQEKWETQSAFVLAWIFEMLDRAESADEKAARGARGELQTFFLNLGGQLLRVALSKEGSDANQWAGRVLADIFVGIGKYVGKVRLKKPYGKLTETNAAFRNEKKLIGKLRTDVLFPAQVRAIAQRELKQALTCRRRLMLLSTVKGWQKTAKKQKIPQKYWPAMKLPEFSVKWEPAWWKFLWPLIQNEIDLSKLPLLAQHDHTTGGIKRRERYLSDCQKTARDHLKALARLRDKSVFF
jgi:hypothetical protein